MVQPDDVLVVIVLAHPTRFIEDVRSQLDEAPAVWHWFCAPRAVREYAPAVLPPSSSGS